MLPCALAVLALAVGHVRWTSALAPTCVNVCMDEFDVDVQVCDDQLDAGLAAAAAEKAECLEEANGDPPGIQGCLNAAAQKQKNAIKRHQQCLKRANMQFDQCSQKCEASPS